MERWLAGALLILLTVNMGFVNYMMVRELQKPLCVFDIQRFIDFLSSQNIDERKADLLLTEARSLLEDLECRAVFVKGALITGEARDVTQEVISVVVKNLRDKAAE